MEKHVEWTRAELARVRQLLAFTLREEAAASPALGPWVETVLARPGKMLRPRLVLAGARLGAAQTDSAAPGADDSGADDSGAADPAHQASATQDDGELEALRDALRSRIGHGTFPLEPVPAFNDWKEECPVPGGLPNRLYLLAVAIETLHLASLAHDDVIDSSPLRRGNPSAPALLGPSGAVLAGDLLLTLCFSLVNEGASGPVAQTLSGMVRLMVRSELAQSAERQRFDAILCGEQPLPGRRQYLRTIGGKTALLFAMALAAGAAEAGARGTILKRLEHFGFSLGLAFQMVDDLLDLDAGEAFGKRPGQDLLDGQITLPLLLGLKKDRDGRLAAAVRAFRRNEAPLEGVIGILEESRVFTACQQEIDTWSARARRELTALEKTGLPREALAELDEILRFAVERSH